MMTVELKITLTQSNSTTQTLLFVLSVSISFSKVERLWRVCLAGNSRWIIKIAENANWIALKNMYDVYYGIRYLLLIQFRNF